MMAFLIIAGFYLFYNTSKRAEVPSSMLRNWVSHRRMLTRYVSFLVLIGSFIMFIQYYGLGAGVFIALALLMTIASLVVLLVPLINKRK